MLVQQQLVKEMNVQSMDEASAALLKIAPVTFHYKPELDPSRTPQFGLIAEEVEKVNPDLVVRDDKGNPYSVRYEAVNAMLLKHRKVEQQNAEIQELKQSLAGLEKMMQTGIRRQQNEGDRIGEISKIHPQH